MNAELHPFKNGKRNSESMSTLDRGLTLLINNMIYLYKDYLNNPILPDMTKVR